jgi:predicted nucleic acid-binding protein
MRVGFVDALIAATAERLNIKQLLTLDEFAVDRVISASVYSRPCTRT